MSEAIYMFNALWFKPDGGREKYAEYGQAVAPLIAQAGAEVQGGTYTTVENLLGKWDPDLFFIVKYPSKEAFDSMINSPEYAEIAHLREEALTNSLLIRCNPSDWTETNINGIA